MQQDSMRFLSLIYTTYTIMSTSMTYIQVHIGVLYYFRIEHICIEHIYSEYIYIGDIFFI